MKHDDLVELVAEVDEPFQVGQEESPEMARADHRSVLCAEVIPDKEHVDRIARRLEDTPRNAQVVIRAAGDDIASATSALSCIA